MKQFLAVAAVLLTACETPKQPPVADGHYPTPKVDDDGFEPGSTKFDVGAPDYCEAFGADDPSFDVAVDEDGHPVISPNYCQGLVASCYITGVGSVTMWCDFKECDETRSITVDMPTEPGLYSISFPDPCGDT